MGNDAVIGSVEEGVSALVLLAEDLSPRTVKGVELAAQNACVDTMRIVQTMDQISMALGKRCGVFACFQIQSGSLWAMERDWVPE